MKNKKLETSKNKQNSEESTGYGIRPTGIDELDVLLQGGIPEGHAVLLAGRSGTGKSVLAMQWIFNGYLKFNEPGIYITLTEPITKAIKNLRTMSFYDESLLSPLEIHFTDLRTIVKLLELEDKKMSKLNIDNIIGTVENLVKETKARRLVIDSITAMAYILNDKDLIRYFIFRLGTMIANLGCTTILTSEVTDHGYSIFGVEEFISDGIIKLERSVKDGEVERTLEIVKMRGMDYATDVNSFKINNDGINLFLKPKPPLAYVSRLEKISTGIKALDKMCDGGIFRGSASLITGATGTGKTIASLQFILEGLKKGENCVYVSFEESRSQILRNSKGFGWDLEKYEKKGLLTFLCDYPERAHPSEHLDVIIKAIEKNRPKRFVIDSLSSIGIAFSESDFRNFTKRLVAYLKSKEITSFMTSATGTLMGTEMVTESNLSLITDNIFLLKYIEKEGKLCFMISVLKTRGSYREQKLRDYTITKKGIVIGEALSGFEGTMTGLTRKVTELEKEREALKDALDEKKRAEKNLGNAYKRLKEQHERLERFNKIAVGREMKMIELKEEVNSQLEKSGQPKKYNVMEEIKEKS